MRIKAVDRQDNLPANAWAGVSRRCHGICTVNVTAWASIGFGVGGRDGLYSIILTHWFGTKSQAADSQVATVIAPQIFGDGQVK